MASEEMIVFRKVSLSGAIATNRIERFGQNNMFGGELLKNISAKLLTKYLQQNSNKGSVIFTFSIVIW